MKRTNEDGSIIIIRKMVYTLLRLMPEGTEFNGWELKEECVKHNPSLSSAYVETFLRAMRQYRHDTGAKIICINRLESRYRKEAR